MIASVNYANAAFCRRILMGDISEWYDEEAECDYCGRPLPICDCAIEQVEAWVEPTKED